MKQFLTMAAVLFVLAACNNNKEEAAKTESGTAATVTELPFKLQRPYMNWQTGSTENAVAAMNALKYFVDSDFTGLAGTLADSVEISVDYFSQKMDRDSAIRLFTAMRPMYKDLRIEMGDYESVISADKKEEWVTLWYKQIWTDEKGKTDSLSVINDCKIVNGKMAELDERVRHYAAKK